MNCITKITDENKALKATLARQEAEITAFRAFLASPKFHNDTTIQVRDVDRRLVDMWHGLVVGDLEDVA